jgi:thioredoxin 1
MNSRPCKVAPLEIGETDFPSQVLEATQPVLVAFLAPWSRPCQVLGAVLDEVAAGCGGKVKVFTVNADDNPDLSLWYEVQSIPALLFFLGGTLRARLIGTASQQAIVAKFDTLLKAAGTPAINNERSKL